MKSTPEKIKKLVKAATFDKNLQQAVSRATSSALFARKEIVSQIPFWETLREKNSNTKKQVINNLDKYLTEFEKNCSSRGMTTHWAVDSADAVAIIKQLIKRHKVKKIVKSKSLTTEEIQLNSSLAGESVEVVETDLGEYIIQLKDESPSHLIIPALHLSKKEIGSLFQEQLGCQYTEDPAQLLAIAREKLRQKFLSADMGITGANFAIAESGQLVIVENEANAHLTFSLPKIHVALLGIEKILPSLKELPDFLKVLAPSATGQKSSTYVNIIGGPLWDKYREGPHEVHIILLDNGRSRILADPLFREILSCIRCGSCLNICPVYRQAGGHSYGWVYMGPIGIVLSPLFLGLKTGKISPSLCTLCRACYKQCPVKIDLPTLILKLREKIAGKGYSGLWENLGFKFWGLISKNPTFYRWGTFLIRQIQKLVPRKKTFPVPGYTGKRVFPRFAAKGFSQLYSEFTRSKNGGDRR